MAVKLPDRTALEAIPMTPLIDVVFQLLVFFLVATTLSEEEYQMDIVVPEASEAQPLIVRPQELVVNVDAAGQYFVAGRRVGLEELYGLFRTAAASNPGRAAVLIRADRRCQWEFVVAAMNACNKAKIRDYKVTTLKGST
ncbi:MAG: ExbD/TolR family protein [Thermoguttaceae bacterium]